MNVLWFCAKKPFIWLSRFRHRCGYGVHSPFAFNLITDVIYEKRAYYAYDSLDRECKEREDSRLKYLLNDRKVYRLLFRLVNYVQPSVMIELGKRSSASLYMQSAKSAADYLFASDLSELFLDADTSIDFLYLNDYRNVALMRQAFQVCVSRSVATSLFVIRGIGYSREMKSFWKELQCDERVGITFDLYDVGLLFFDRAKIKQHYIVNF